MAPAMPGRARRYRPRLPGAADIRPPSRYAGAIVTSRLMPLVELGAAIAGAMVAGVVFAGVGLLLGAVAIGAIQF